MGTKQAKLTKEGYFVRSWSTMALDAGENDYFERPHEDVLYKDFGTQNVPDEFEHDPYSFELYREAISQGQETDSKVRINVVGNFAQGKTSLTKRLSMQETKGIESTNSVEINHCKCVHTNDNVIFYTKDTEQDESEVIKRIVSVAQLSKEKQDRIQEYISEENIFTSDDFTPETSSEEPVPSTSSNINATFSIDVKSKRRIKNSPRSVPERYTINKLNKSRNNNKRIPALTRNEQKEFSRLLESNRNENNQDRDLEIWDFGGQFIFYATHTLFHSRHAIYLLVFDLTVPLDEVIRDLDFPEETGDKDMEQYARFWMNSIHTYVGSDDGSEPPVILVGTHKDKLKGDESTKHEYKDEYFEKIRKLFEDTVLINHIQSADFAVDNTYPEDTGILELRKEIIRLGAKCAKVTHIPARWIPLERALKRIRNEKIIEFERVMAVDSENEFPLQDEEQVKLFLHYHHAKGTLVYFGEEPISAYVVLDAQYLIDAFKCIVTSTRFCRTDHSCRHLWNTLKREARLENELIEKLWGLDAEKDFLKHKSVLLMFLQKHLIISEAFVYDDITQTSHGLGWYIVPSLLSDPSSKDTLKEFLTRRQQTSVRFVMSFRKSPLVRVVFNRLLAALLGKWPVVQIASTTKKTLLYENLGVFRLDDSNAGIVEMKHSDIDLRVLNLCPSSNVDHATTDKFRRFTESIVKQEFRKLRQSAVKLEKPYASCFRCNGKDHGLIGGINKLSLEHIRGKKLVPCPDMMSHEIHPKQALSEWFLDNRQIELTPDCKLNEKQLSKVSQTIGKNWEMLGLELGLHNAQLQQIDMDYQTSEMKIYKMLLEWRAMKEMKDEEATMNTLVQAMKTERRVYVEWDEIRNIIENIDLERASI